MKRKVWMTLVCLFLSGMLCRETEADDVLVTAVENVTLEPGDNLIHGFTYYDGYLWASTRTSPCRILRVDPATLDYERIILDPGLNDGEDLIAAEGYIWVILWIAPSKIVRVDPETLEWEVALSFQGNELFEGGSLEYAYGYLWAGGRNGKIARIDLSDMSYQVYDYSGATGNFQFHAMTSGGGYIWGSSHSYRDSWFWGREYIGHTIVRIDPANPTNYSSLYIDDTHMSDDIAYMDGYLYAGSEESPSYIYRISHDLSYTTARGGDTVCYGVFAWEDSIWGAYVGSPGRIARFDLNLNLEAAYQLPSGLNSANEMAFDPSGNLYYVTCWESPAKIVKLQKREVRYFVSSIPQKDRGGVIIPVELFPEGKGDFISIYVPPVVDGSNALREDNGWRTVKEIERSELSFEWEKLALGFTLGGADTPAGAGLSAAAGLIEALHSAIAVYGCKVTVQGDASGNHRAMIQVGDPASRTYVRAHAGEAWDPFAESFWLIQAVFSEEIAEAFSLEPDSYPRMYYTMLLTPVEPGLIEMLSPSASQSAIVVQGRSPIELRVYDSGGRVTGLVDSEVREEIPRSIYDAEHNIAMILSPDGAYRYEVIGTGQGEYELEAAFVQEKGSIAFAASHIPTSDDGVHQYTIDWGMLFKGGEGVTVQMDDDGDGAFEQTVTADSQFTRDEYLVATGVTPDGKQPATWAELKRTALFQNYPNPFNPDTWIPYTLSEQTRVTVRIYSASGQLVSTLDLGEKQAGAYLPKEKAADWDGCDESGQAVASGLYFCTLQADSFRATRKMAVAR